MQNREGEANTKDYSDLGSTFTMSGSGSEKGYFSNLQGHTFVIYKANIQR
jgi:hypothetical protein